MAQLPKSHRPAYARGRRRPKAFTILGIVFTAIVLAWFFESQATTTIIFVRHADTDAQPGSALLETRAAASGQLETPADPLAPSLTARGRVRAQLLADFLEAVDVVAGVDAVYASAFGPTRE